MIKHGCQTLTYHRASHCDRIAFISSTWDVASVIDAHRNPRATAVAAGLAPLSGRLLWLGGRSREAWPRSPQLPSRFSSPSPCSWPCPAFAVPGVSASCSAASLSSLRAPPGGRGSVGSCSPSGVGARVGSPFASVPGFPRFRFPASRPCLLSPCRGFPPDPRSQSTSLRASSSR